MAKATQPTFVETVGKDGRKIYNREFKAALVNDVKSGKVSLVDAAAKHKVNYYTAHAWVRRSGVNMRALKRNGFARDTEAFVDPLVERPAIVDKVLRIGKTKPEGTLLERAKAAREGADSKVTEGVELALAFIGGEINEADVRRVVQGGAERFHLNHWLGGVFAGAIRSGWRLTR